MYKIMHLQKVERKQLLSKCGRGQKANNDNLSKQPSKQLLMDPAVFKAFMVPKLKHICFPS